ncbi:MAG: primosomal protein N' [Pyrinomonadaceae bacterium]
MIARPSNHAADEDVFVEVALPLPLRRTFTYRVAPELNPQAGCRVVVEFGRRVVTGFVVEVHGELPSELEIETSKVKRVLEVLDAEPLLTGEIIRLAQWTADYYLSFPGEVLRAALPAGISGKANKIYSITDKGRRRLSGILIPDKLQEKVLAYVDLYGPCTEKDLARTVGRPGVEKILRSLAADGSITAGYSEPTGAVKPKRRKAVRLIETEGSADDKRQPTAAQQKVLVALAAAGGEMLYTDLLESAEVSGSAITTLEKRGRVEVYIQEVERDPFAAGDLQDELPELKDLTLSAEQDAALGEIVAAVGACKYRAFLLHGVTGSGKTEVYFRAMRAALDAGKSALMLVPEIALTPLFSRRLRSIFGTAVAILHSSLSAGERFDEWRRIRRGEARIVIGTRSAVFAPLTDLGLIVVDEEHDTSYRQHESPFYHARDVAVMRASLGDAVVVLGSATPAMETFHNARTGKYSYLQLPGRIGGRPMAAAEIVDMRLVFKQHGKDVVFSPDLIEAIETTHLRGEQSIVLLNRRGFSQFVLCRTCGESIKCQNCDISLTYHRGERLLICHYCNYRIDVPKKCPHCASEYLYFIGEGTEQLEDRLVKKFPHLRIARVDRDTVAKRNEMERVLTTFARGELDMLVGTQMIAKGHDFPNVTLVGVISVDLSLGIPDFRSAERTFQLLTQVAGRAGRGDLRGKVLIQSYYPEHYALRHAKAQDYEGFYKEETRYRERMGYPPYSALAMILIRHADLGHAKETADQYRRCLDRANADKVCRILGPAPASLARLKGEYRVQILIKSANRRRLRETIDLASAAAESAGLDMRIIHVEIDPVNLL